MNPLVNPNAQNGAQPSHVFVPPGGAYASHPPPTEQPQVAPSENPPTRTTSPSATLSRLSNIFVGAATRAGDPQAPIDLSLSHHVGPPPPQRNRYRTIPLPPLPSSPDDAQTSYREVEILDAYPSRINGDPSEATPNLSSIGVFDASPQVQTAWQVPRYLLSTRNLKVETPISIERFLTILDSCVDLESLTVSIAASEPPETTVIARPATAANLIELSMKTAIVPKSLLDAFVTPRLRILRLEWDAQSSGNPMPITEALAPFPDPSEPEPIKSNAPLKPSLWRDILFVTVGQLEALTHLAHASYLLITSAPVNDALISLLLALSWLYTILRPVISPTRTVPYDLFTVYSALFVGAVLQLGGVFYDHGVFRDEWPSVGVLVALWANVVVTTGVLGVVLGMPLALPGRAVKEEEIGLSVSPEDYTSLFGWITFSWVYPLVHRGRYTTLNEKDVWALSPTLQSRSIFIKFVTLPQTTLLRKLFTANSLDLFLDFSLTLVSALFNYIGPFFLKRILDAIDLTTPTPESRTQAYIYAVLAFICSLCKAQANVQHLWFGRRAGTRIRSELMASIYDKALKRKDFSGIVRTDKKAGTEDKDEEEEGRSKSKNKSKKDEQQSDEAKAGADIGKIVNLMAGDADKVSRTVSASYVIYGAPFEILLASIFLYNLLGLAAFAGFFVLLLCWPLNSYIARGSIRIQKGLLGARDRRMGVLSEMMSAVKFIKFFAWEGKWVERVMEMREEEMRWMVKARVNSVAFSLLWTSAPILISIISFFVYTMQGNELTISTAFTAIALFNMVRAPLNVIPTWIVRILQTGVALNRIAVYLGEDEVSEQVSSLKKDASQPTTGAPSVDNADEEEGLGIENGSFKWNEVEVPKADSENANKGKNKDGKTSPAATIVEGEGKTQVLLEEGMSDAPLPEVDMDHRFELRDINVRFPEGELTVITGPTASGKTTLLMALLGEMTLLPSTPPGKLIMSKSPSKLDSHSHGHPHPHSYSLSYAAQAPWLRHQSIRDNILFGAPFDSARYGAVLDACALKTDLHILEDGDLTEIGTRGVSLSGGQKARVALARAVYSRARYVLLDDPLSAVDYGTAGWIVENLLKGELLEGRTVILVTHHVDLVLPAAHYFVRMLDGRIDTQGTIKDLRTQGELEELTHDSAVTVAEAEVQQEALVPTSSDSENTDRDEEEAKKAKAGKKPRKLVKDEHREVGNVKWAIYKSYLKASYVPFSLAWLKHAKADYAFAWDRSYWIWGFLAFLVLVAQVLGASEKVWIMIWGEAYKEGGSATSLYPFTSFAAKDHSEPLIDSYHAPHHYILPSFSSIFITDKGRFGINWPRAIQHPLFYVGIYAAIGLAYVFLGVMSMFAQYTGALRASRILFKQVLVTVVRATFRFHDTTPQGRMLNRFGKDIETIDSSLAGSLQAVNTSLANLFTSIVLVAFIFPWFLIPAIFIGLAHRELAVGYLNTGRDLRRMESNTRSPIFSDFGELLEGIVTVRAFSAERRFLDNLHTKIDTTTQMWYSFWMTNRWLLLNFDALGALAVLITTLFSIATLANGAGLAGICITTYHVLSKCIGSVVFGLVCPLFDDGLTACADLLISELELDLNSVERVVEYLDLPQEPPAILELNRAPAYWPSSSNNDSLVVVEDLEIKYAPDLPAVLQDVSFTLKAGEHVDPTSGRILIDGIDISTIGIHDLRSRVTFIPQDATLFSGTLRENLDPFNEHTDVECLDVLQRCHMINSPSVSPSASHAASSTGSSTASIHSVEREDTAESISTNATSVETKTTVSLETQVSAGGTNFSQGQRQLIAMARALLRRSSIIVLDEATSSIDLATDAKIQTTIREEFDSSLLLTVAHRLRTVIDYDRLVVLDQGRIAEFDTPWKLIQKEGGIFRTMCLKSGSFGDLEHAAKSKAERDNKL
ncbi:hypothetical protein DXG01_002481 [Tephrocybe rancida]|nr:hypothetical protein DXG01_002481 [Tephrocybe rancida]